MDKLKKLFESGAPDSEIGELCCELFIGDNGSVNYDNINVAKSYDIRVFAAERDGFGWITGGCKHGSRTVYFG